MASVNPNIMMKKDWPLANPWLWLTAGFAFTLWSWLWTLMRGEIASDYRVIVLALGLLLSGVGLWLRWRDRQTLFLLAWRAPIALLLGCIFGLLALGITGLFIASFFVEESVGLKPAALFLVWLTSAPICFAAARRCVNREINASETPSPKDAQTGTIEEVALAFLAVAAICVLGSFTLYADREDPADWDSIRLFLRVGTVVSLYASALTLVSMGLRRLMLSVLFTLHFMGIATAALSAPPAPWIVQQAWMRLFRPYLEFAYLNNAYHFYAPEPGPSHYLWFRIIYTSPDGKSDDGMWFKIPQLDEKGRIQHPVALDYQRFLSMTEFVDVPGPVPTESYFNFKNSQWENNPFWANRLSLVPMPNQAVVIGKERSKYVPIPLHPAIAFQQQVFIPTPGSKKLLASYAHFVASKHAVHPDPEKGDWTFKSVKVYRVVHWIPPVQWFLNHIPPTDPETYRAFYIGNYKADGTAENDQDPYLYWWLPALRDNQNDPDSQIHDYARLHAGDPQWIRRGTDKKWVKEGEQDR